MAATPKAIRPIRPLRFRSGGSEFMFRADSVHSVQIKRESANAAMARALGMPSMGKTRYLVVVNGITVYVTSSSQQARRQYEKALKYLN